MIVNHTFSEGFTKLYEEFLGYELGRNLLKVDGIGPEQIDVGLMSKAYFKQNLPDITVDANANANEGISANNYISEATKGILKLDGYYLIWHYARKRFGEERANDLLRSIWSGDIYFHDASSHMVNIPYCWAYSTTTIMIEGRPYGQLQSLPPKRADSFIAQIVEVTMDLSQEFAGAITPADMLVNYAWYAKNENLPDYRILNDLQKFVHVVNNKFRMGGQSPFVNLSLFDRENLNKVFKDHVYPDGTGIDVEYIMRIQKLFGEWFAKGDPVTGLPYRFPVCTINISKDSEGIIKDQDFLDWVAKTNIEKGCFNIYVNDGHKVASCCRLVNDFERMQFRTDSFGNGGMNIGSHRVITVNLPRVALLAGGSRIKFYDVLEKTLDNIADLLQVHREDILDRRVKRGFLKFFEPLKWFNLEQLFSTIGVVGIYEMAYFMGLDIRTDEGSKFVAEVLLFIEDRAKEYSTKYQHSFNVEEIPAESTAVKLAQKDSLMGLQSEFSLYSNQYIPLISEATLPERVKLTGKFMDILSGGGILHLNIKEQIKDPEVMKKLINYAVQNKVSHFAINYGFGTCVNGHTSVVGTGKTCPICGGEVREWLTRVIGYFTKVTSWHSVRREYEFPNRKFM
jgi:ribonucleoside-triphosphate reductase